MAADGLSTSIKLRYINRTHLKNVFWPNIFVGASLQILDIQQYASGLKLGPAAILNQNPIFEMGSNNSLTLKARRSCQEMSKNEKKKEFKSVIIVGTGVDFHTRIYRHRSIES